MITLQIHTLENEIVGEVELDESIFGIQVREDVLHRMICWQRAKRRTGTHKTKGISEVRGTGRKPYRQKGTGRARLGSLHVPQARGGAVIFGPQPRSHAIKLSKKFRKLALRMALSTKVNERKLRIIQSFDVDTHKTQILKKKFQTLDVVSALVIDVTVQQESNFVRAVRNLPHLDVLPQQGLNVYDILRHDYLLLSTDTLSLLEERLK